MQKIVAVDSTGQVKHYEYDGRRAKFFRDGVPLVVQFGNATKKQHCDCGKEAAGKPTYEAVECTLELGHAPAGDCHPSLCNCYCSNGSSEPSRQKPKYGHRLTSPGKSRDFKTLKILLGMACNYKCTYCKQAVHAGDAAVSGMADVERFIGDFDDWCQVPREDGINIQLWGGEPLVYMPKLRRLVAFFRERFDQATIIIISNGSLVSKEIVEFLVENDIGLTISHDGPGQLRYRSGDPIAADAPSLPWLKEYIVMSRRRLGVNAVLTKQNQDPQATADHVRRILGPSVQVGFEGIVTVESQDQFDADSLFGPEDYHALRANLRDAVLSGALGGISPFGRKFGDLVGAWQNPEFEVCDDSQQKCGMDDPHVLAVDLKGNVLLCHGVSETIGHVADWDGIDLMGEGKARHWSSKPECRACPVLSMCHGACMNLRGPEWALTCENEFHFNLAIFEAAFQLVFGDRIISIGGLVRPGDEPAA